MLTQERLQELMEYDPEKGLFKWRNIYRKQMLDWFAGAKLKSGYRQIRVDGVTEYAHRLAWLYVNGKHEKYLDHANRDKFDNRIANLRPATKSDNTCNSKTRADNNSGHRGIWYWEKRNRWQAYVNKDGRRHTHLFSTRDEAVAWREKMAAEMHKEFKSSSQT
jgi:hypothetical protein